jgi:hypothetical protein
VKQAIENDFREGVLRILVSTNTLGQGVNLPIRFVVVHSVTRWIPPVSDDEVGHSESVKVRDYWNICGRAGRATWETEGQIIHIVNSPQDLRLLNAYSTREEIEPALSALITVLRDIADRRLTNDQFARALDSQVLSILIEDGGETLSEEQLKSLISSSLVGVQCSRLGYDLTPLVRKTWLIANSLREQVGDPPLQRLFASTGLSLATCKHLMQRVMVDLPEVTATMGLPYRQQLDALARLAVAAAWDTTEARVLRKFPGTFEDLTSLVLDWIHGATVELISRRY